jgi:site-specific recombinase XerD
METLTPLTTAAVLDLLPDWELAMVAENKSPHTIKVYVGSVRHYLTWTDAHGHAPMELGTLNQWVAGALAVGRSGSTAAARLTAMRRITAWLIATGRLTDDPFRGAKYPKVHTRLVKPLTDEELSALLRTCEVDDDALPDVQLWHRRDEAIIRVMLETAIRKGEVMALELGDIDLDDGLVTIRHGKGGKSRNVPIGPYATRALRAYLRHRTDHPLATTPQLWVGTRGRPMGYEGLRNTLRRRAQRAGIEGFHPHRLRHTAAHRWLAKGGSEVGLMAVAGWSRTDMLIRYTRAHASERAAEEARRLNLGAL